MEPVMSVYTALKASPGLGWMMGAALAGQLAHVLMSAKKNAVTPGWGWFKSWAWAKGWNTIGAVLSAQGIAAGMAPFMAGDPLGVQMAVAGFAGYTANSAINRRGQMPAPAPPQDIPAGPGVNG